MRKLSSKLGKGGKKTTINENVEFRGKLTDYLGTRGGEDLLIFSLATLALQQGEKLEDIQSAGFMEHPECARAVDMANKNYRDVVLKLFIDPEMVVRNTTKFFAMLLIPNGESVEYGDLSWSASDLGVLEPYFNDHIPYDEGYHMVIHSK